MSNGHIHKWEDVSYDYMWTYETIRCTNNDSYGSEYTTWTESRVYQKENPGSRPLRECVVHYEDHVQYADPETIIHQKCECGDYRDQKVDGILNNLISKEKDFKK